MTITDVIKDATTRLIGLGGNVATETEHELKQIMADLEPEFEQALVSEDIHSVDFVADRVAARVAQATATQLSQVKDTVGIIALTALKGAILLAA